MAKTTKRYNASYRELNGFEMVEVHRPGSVVEIDHT